MKRWMLLLAFSVLPIASTVQASVVVSGPVKVQDKSMQGLIAHGPVHIERSQIQGKTNVNGLLRCWSTSFQQLQVNGPFYASDVQVHEATINGSVEMEGVKVTGRLQVSGTFKAKHCTLQKVVLSATRATLQDCTVEDVVVHAEGVEGNKKQRLYLQGTFHAQGSIVFASGRGVVYVSEGMLPLPTVKGGRIVLR